MEDETVRSVNRDKGDVSDSSISSRDEFDPSNADTTSFDYCDGVILCLDVRGTAFGCSVLDFRTKVLKILPEDFQLRIRYGASSNGDACYTEEINDSWLPNFGEYTNILPGLYSSARILLS